MKLRSFQMRILVWTWALLLVVMAVVFVYSTNLVGDELIAETEDLSWRQMATVKWLVRDHQTFSDEHELDEWIGALGFKLGFRVSYIANGRVLADSGVPFHELGSLDDHSTRPEVLDAVKDGEGVNIRYSSTLSKEMLYVASRIQGAKGLPDGVLRLAVPFSQVSARLSSLRSNFIWIFLGTLVLAAIVSALMSRNMSRQITTFSKLASDIGEGGYSQRLRLLPGGEFKPLAESVNAMAEKIEHHIHTIEEQKGKLEAIFEGMHDGVMTLDSEGRIESYNSALDGMFNLPKSTVGRTVIEVSRRFELQDLVDTLLEDPELEETSAQMTLMDSRTVEVSGVPFFDKAGVRKLIMVFHDITEMKRSEKGLKDFVANASHQLRTPLTSIKGYSETLLDNPPTKPEESAYFLETVIKNADHMDKVLSSMLALAKSEQMGKALTIAPVSGRDILNRAVDDLGPLSSERGISFRTHIPDDHIMVMAEPDALLHVFHNLMQNGVKYSPEGGVITVSAENDGESVVFCVEDQGPGISRELSTKVFERFYRVDGNTIDGAGSAGLGLAICRRIVKNLDGEIWHDGAGENSRGARFCFRLVAAS